MTETSNPLDVSHLWAPYRSNTSRRRDILPYHEEYGELVINTELLAYLIRSYSVFEMTCAGLGHPGGSFSEAEFLSVLYNYALRFDPDNPE